MDKRTICLLNDSFPPEIDGVANAVVNYDEKHHEKRRNAIVVTPTMPGADDSAFPFPVLRYPSIDTRKKLGYVAGYPFFTRDRARADGAEGRTDAHALSHHVVPAGALAARRGRRAARADVSHEVRCRHRQGCARQALAGERHSRAGAEHRKLR